MKLTHLHQLFDAQALQAATFGAAVGSSCAHGVVTSVIKPLQPQKIQGSNWFYMNSR